MTETNSEKGFSTKIRIGFQLVDHETSVLYTPLTTSVIR